MQAVVPCVVLACILFGSSAVEADPSTTFSRKCTACHTYGRGVLVGPDLKGVTERHTRQWLTAWISSSETVIRSGDPAAVALFGFSPAISLWWPTRARIPSPFSTSI